MATHQLTSKMAALILELFTLNNTVRTGWGRAGVPVNEQGTVASHSFGSAAIAYILAVTHGGEIDPYRTVTLALLHDTGETRTADIPRLLKEILEEQGLSKEQIDQRAEELQRQGLPRWLQTSLKEPLEEYRRGETAEAQIAFDAQLIDLGVQALWFQRRGYPTEEFTAGVEPELRSEVGRNLWKLICETPDILTAWFSRSR